MMMLAASDRWKAVYPGAFVGILAMSAVANPESCPQLDARKEDLEALLRSNYASLNRSQLRSHPLVEPYAAYYRRFDKTYHVQLQLESVVIKAKSIPRVAALVEAMFMAELKNLLLTAGHDLDTVQGQLGVDVANGVETYVMLNGQQQTLKRSDMFIHDEEGVLSSVIHGPGYRSRITSATTRVLFTVYAPTGIAVESVRDHLGDLKHYVLIVAPGAQVEHLQVVGAGWGI
jgi:DNA/RNA-binding domain of Phe-tRNA-synthetase-like protein